MKREKKLVKNTFFISLGKICTSLLTFLLLPLYTGVLSPAEYGIVDLLNTLTILLLPIVTFQIEKAVFRELIESRNDDKKISQIITTSSVFIFFQILIFIMIFLLCSLFIKNEYKLFLMINIIAYIMLSFFQQISRGLDNIKKYTIGSFVSAITAILFNVILLVIIPMGATGMLLATFIGYLTGSAYLFFSLKLYRYFNFSENKRRILKILLKYSVPLIPNALSWWIFSASDRLIVTTFLGADYNGILAVALKFSSIITALYTIFDTSWIESMSSHIDDDDIEVYFNNVIDKIMRIFISISILMTCFLPFVFQLLVNEKFEAGYYLIPISIISALFNTLQGVVVVTYAAKKDTKAIANTSIYSAIINICVHLLLIKFIGLYAAVLSTLVSFVIMSIYRCCDINKKYIKIRVNEKLILSTIALLLIIIPLYYLNNFYLNILSIVISVIYSILINKNSINFIKDMFLKKIKGNGENKYES